jgi:hypothetical protein
VWVQIWQQKCICVHDGKMNVIKENLNFQKEWGVFYTTMTFPFLSFFEWVGEGIQTRNKAQPEFAPQHGIAIVWAKETVGKTKDVWGSLFSVVFCLGVNLNCHSLCTLAAI